MKDFLPQGIPVHCEPQQIFLAHHRETDECLITCNRKDLRSEHQDLTDDPELQAALNRYAEELGEYLLIPEICSSLQRILNAYIRTKKRRVLQWPEDSSHTPSSR